MAISHDETMLSFNPVGWWKFTGASTTIQDETVNNNDLVITSAGAGATSTPSQTGAIITETATNDSYRLDRGQIASNTTRTEAKSSDVATFAGKTFSIGCWLKIDTAVGIDETVFPIAVYDNLAGVNNYIRIRFNSQATPNIKITWIDGGATNTGADLGDYEFDKWFHILLTVDNADTAIVYYNGQAIGSPEDLSAQDVDFGSDALVNFGSNGFGFGMIGLVDEGVYFDRVLTPTEARALYRSGAEIAAFMGDPQYGFADSRVDEPEYPDDEAITERLHSQRFNQAVDEINAVGPVVTCIVGDNSNQAPTSSVPATAVIGQRQVDRFDNDIKRIAGTAMLTPGNHDQIGDKADVTAWRTKYENLGFIPSNETDGVSFFVSDNDVTYLEYSSPHWYQQESDYDFDAADRTALEDQINAITSAATGPVVVFTHIPIWLDTETTIGSPASGELELNAQGGFREDVVTVLRINSNIEMVIVGHVHLNEDLEGNVGSPDLRQITVAGTARVFGTGTLTEFTYLLLYTNADGDTYDWEWKIIPWSPLRGGIRGRSQPGTLRRPFNTRGP